MVLFMTMTMNAQTKLRADNIDEVLKAMTLEEKAQLLVGGGNDGFVGSGAMMGHQEKLVAGAAGTTVGIDRLGIDPTGDMPVYDLSGRRLGPWDTLPAGIYVLRLNGQQYKLRK